MAWFVMLAAAPAMAQAMIVTDRMPASAPIAPADRLDQLDRFRDSLSRGDRQRLDKALPRSADGGIARCDRTEGSRASCEVAAYMPALRKTGLMPRFRRTVRTTPS